MYTWHLLRKYILSVVNTDTQKENKMISASRGLHWAGLLEGIEAAGGVSVCKYQWEESWWNLQEVCACYCFFFFFFSGEGCCVFLQSKSLETMIIPTTGGIGFSLLILTISRCLRFADFWLGWNQSGTFMWCTPKQGKLVTHTAPLAPRCDRNSLAEQFPLGTE